MPSQTCPGEGQIQFPFTQAGLSGVHGIPQPSQFEGSFRGIHTPLQTTLLSQVHIPFTQAGLSGVHGGLSHEPQYTGLA
ncbi:MAG: hypothetical protein KKD18_00700 [Nanoarchaeota archaeon]|nr:hypothetical protein [Nanoarchaeota archaeon]MBU0976916.1 hypothetical protein [Nanoarchaeota archaeon]